LLKAVVLAPTGTPPSINEANAARLTGNVALICILRSEQPLIMAAAIGYSDAVRLQKIT
jgi:hypothetical protein